MAKEKKQKKEDDDDRDKIEETIDPYTGELKPVPEDADQFIEVVPEETKDRKGRNYLLNEETSMDSYASDADAIAEQSAHYTEDEDIKDDFDRRQDLAAGGRDQLLEDLEEHHSLSPEISGGDLDASWQSANVAGEETVGGSVPTPDQDVVDELGEAAGLTYADDEPLNSDKKVLNRDRNRWELNPASAQEDELDNQEDNDEDDDELDEDEDLDEFDEAESEDLDEDELDDEDLEDDELDDEDEYIDAEIEDEEDKDV